MRYKMPDKKNALSLMDAAKKEMAFTLKLQVNEEAGPTIVRNIYESFRMLGDALLISEGMESEDHVMPIKELLKLRVETDRPINLIDNLRRFRHNINYYGYQPKLSEIKDTISIARSCFDQLYLEVLKKIK